MNVRLQLHLECCMVVLKYPKIIVGSLYRSPNGFENIFLERLEQLLLYLSQYKAIVVLGGDINAKFDVTKTLPTQKMLKNILKQFDFQHTNDKPTWGKACIDNDFINLQIADCSCCVVHHDIADFEGVELIVRVKDESRLNNRPISTVTFRKLSVARLDSFTEGLSNLFLVQIWCMITFSNLFSSSSWQRLPIENTL